MGFFGKLLSPKREALPRTSPATAERIRNILGIRELEAMPAQAARAFQLASDPNAKLADFVTVIESDESLSARVIRIANSVYYFRGTQASDIEKAVANIGLDELRCLLSATMLKSLLNSRATARESIWANSVAVGMLSRMLARNTRDINTGEAFLGGLLHDVGKLVMIRRGGTLYEQVFAAVSVEAQSESGGGFCEAEEKIFELDHVEVGKWVAENWSFPESAREAIALHHRPWPKGDELTWDIPLIVKAADLIAHSIGVGHGHSLRSFQKQCEAERDQILPKFGLSTSLIASIIKDFQKKFDDELSLYSPEGG